MTEQDKKKGLLARVGRGGRFALGAATVVLVVAVGATVTINAQINQKALTASLAQAVRQSTGLDYTAAETHFQFLPWPVVTARQVTLSRPGCAPLMQAKAVRASLEPLALLQRVLLIHKASLGGLVVQTNPEGTGAGRCGWLTDPERQQPTPSQPVPPGTTRALPWHVRLEGLEASKGRILQGTQTYLTLRSLQVRNLQGQPHISMVGQHDAFMVVLEGSLSDLRDLHAGLGPVPRPARPGHQPQHPLAERPWAFSGELRWGVAEHQPAVPLLQRNLANMVQLDGVFRAPSHLQGFSGQIQAIVEDGGALKALLPASTSTAWPEGSFTGLAGRAKLASDGPSEHAGTIQDGSAPSDDSWPGFVARLRTLSSHLYPLSLDASLGQASLPAPGGAVTVQALHAEAPQPTAPLKLSGAFSWPLWEQSWKATAEAATLEGAVKAWRQPEHPLVPFTANLDQASFSPSVPPDAKLGHVALKGQLGRQAMDFTMAGHVPIVPLVAPVVTGAPTGKALGTLWGLHEAVFSSHVSGQLGEGQQGKLLVNDVAFQSHELTASGTVSAIRTAPGKVEQGRAEGTSPATTLDSQLHFSTVDGDALLAGWRQWRAHLPPVAPSPSVQRESWHWWQGLLERNQGDERWTAGQVRLGGLSYSHAQAHLVAAHDVVTLEALKAQVNGIAFDATASMNLQSLPPHFTFHLQPAVLPASLVQEMVGMPPVATGTMALDGTLSTSGDDLATMAGAVVGRLGVSMVNGTLAPSALAPLAGKGQAQSSAAKGRALPLRCLAGHFTFHDGTGAADALALQTGPLTLTGTGSLSPATGALGLVLYDHVRQGDHLYSLPFRLEGTLQQPKPILHDDPMLDVTPGEAENDLCAPAMMKALDGRTPSAALPAGATASLAGPRPQNMAAAIMRAIGH
ncbi:AsmA family protein [Formicincola oecophyllae]|uniref:AsmA family protein n=1 Tax=Formicincola oecophyllae TaxID=2558361 RepID=A0A4Y6U9Q4_9PROT|nr:AsmA family protein [Formicincola oecophyllae]QDH13760.1 AsmA family protein [Formicincola oecophyllae]